MYVTLFFLQYIQNLLSANYFKFFSLQSLKIRGKIMCFRIYFNLTQKLRDLGCVKALLYDIELELVAPLLNADPLFPTPFPIKIFSIFFRLR